MDRNLKISFLLIFLLGIGLVYTVHQVNSLQDRVNEIDYLVIESGIKIDNGSGSVSKTVHLTRGATAFEALERIATVRTEYFSGRGKYISSINSVSNSVENGKFWLIAEIEGGNWKGLSVGADSYTLKDGDNILFWYGDPEEAPFEGPF